MRVVNFVLLFLLITAVTYAVLVAAERLLAAVQAYRRYRGKMLITCPENKCPAAVEVAAGSVAVETIVHQPHLHLSMCSRWPEKEGCGQECLSQIEQSPQDCLVWNIVHNWYAGKACAYCGKPFSHMEWHDRRPALMNFERKTVQWSEIPADKLPEALEAHLPVCWNCHMAETFRRQHADLVVDRPPATHPPMKKAS